MAASWGGQCLPGMAASSLWGKGGQHLQGPGDSGSSFLKHPAALNPPPAPAQEGKAGPHAQAPAEDAGRGQEGPAGQAPPGAAGEHTETAEPCLQAQAPPGSARPGPGLQCEADSGQRETLLECFQVVQKLPQLRRSQAVRTRGRRPAQAWGSSGQHPRGSQQWAGLWVTRGQVSRWSPGGPGLP